MNRFDKETIEQIRAENKPILIYGNKQYAVDVFCFLKENQMLTEAFVVDRGFSVPVWILEGTPVRYLDEYIERIEEYTVVIGFYSIERVRVLMQMRHLLRCRIYRFFNPNILFEWDDSFWDAHGHEVLAVSDRFHDRKSKEVLDALIKAHRNGEPQDLLQLSEGNQYFNELTFEKDSENEVFVDCGAYDGDTICLYNKFVDSKYQEIYAFEPNRMNMSKLKRKLDSLKNVVYVERGAWNEKGKVRFTEQTCASQINENGTSVIEVDSIDNVLSGNRVTFIKMDIEGSEYRALEGGEASIRTWMPKLAICVYHRPDDIYKFIHLLEGYRNDKYSYIFYLRHHSCASYETVLYAIPKRE